MPAITASFSGKVRVQTAISVPDQLNHELNLAEIAGTQKSPDEKWNKRTGPGLSTRSAPLKRVLACQRSGSVLI